MPHGGGDIMDTLVNEVRADILAECRWFADSGHEWLQVPIHAARFADKIDRANGGDGISVFSYVLNTRAFLEGDCDAALFVKAFDLSDSELAGLAARVVVINGPAVIRDYPHWGV
jgi:hypothetical protein